LCDGPCNSAIALVQWAVQWVHSEKHTHTRHLQHAHLQQAHSHQTPTPDTLTPDTYTGRAMGSQRETQSHQTHLHHTRHTYTRHTYTRHTHTRHTYSRHTYTGRAMGSQRQIHSHQTTPTPCTPTPDTYSSARRYPSQPDPHCLRPCISVYGRRPWEFAVRHAPPDPHTGMCTRRTDSTHRIHTRECAHVALIQHTGSTHGNVHTLHTSH
jgi:hypothetical protein